MSSLVGSSTMVDKDGVEYAFAMEYNGPPVGFDIPRAIPINVERIPVASIVTQMVFPNTVPLPVIQPVLPPDTSNKKFSKEISKVGSHTNVSPTSVIDFEKVSGGCEGEKEAELVSKETLLPTSLAVFEERSKSGQNCATLGGDLCSSGTLDDFNGNSESVDWSGLINTSAELDSSSISHEHSRDLVGRNGSLNQSDRYESFAKSRDSSIVSPVSLGSGPNEDSIDPSDLNCQEWSSSKSVLSAEYPSRVSSCRTGKCNSMPHDNVKRPVVTFRDISTYDDTDEELASCTAAEDIRPRKEMATQSKKGACYRCLKGSRFTEKEACIVCNAKYCSNCVLRAMGSMPEGRKCVTCIGYPIDESKRRNLGKCSRILKRLLNDLEIRQIMKVEKLCDVNQLPPEYICINGKPLYYEELILLQTCLNPPKSLKPGSYWYDKVSGLWGKEGEKPSQIITPHLNVGDPIRADASNGNTQVFINGREITKPELRMLQLAGVQCAGNPHFWVNDDGSYLEEGQKNTKGYIWDKAGMKLVCALLSLPVPSKSKQSFAEEISYVVNRPIPEYLGERTLQKLLLVGCSGSGTSTLFKQAKILYKDTPFSEDERQKIKLMIQGNVYGYLGVLLEGRERFEEEISSGPLTGKSSSPPDQKGEGTCEDNDLSVYSLCPRLKEFSDWLLKTMVSGNLDAIFPAATREYAPLVEELWNTTAIQATYNRRSELDMLPAAASYFLERAVDVLQPDYEPSDTDILCAEGVTSSNGLACVDFSFPHSADDDVDSSDQLSSLPKYQLIRVQAKGFPDNCKWLEMLEDIRLGVFCVALSDYDRYTFNPNGPPSNKMLLSKKLFESIVTHPTFEHMNFLLVLNKFDIFEEKIKQVPLTECEWFDDFQPVISRPSNGTNCNRTRSINHNPSLGQLGFHYIAVRFKRLYYDLTGKKLFVSSVTGLETDSVDAALKYGREILKWEDERINFSLSECSIYSTDASFSSP